MRVLCVAEKPSIARAISEILSGGHFNMVGRALVSIYVLVLTRIHVNNLNSVRAIASSTRTLILTTLTRIRNIPSRLSQVISWSMTFQTRIESGTPATHSPYLTRPLKRESRK